MKNLSLLIKPTSSSCDMKCRYCFYSDVSKHRKIKNHGVMLKETAYVLIDKAIADTSEDGTITFAFQGGEPTIAGHTFFKIFCEYVEVKKAPQQVIHYAIQTNGYTIDDLWCELFKKYNFLVGVSLDGYKENHDYFRLNILQKPTFDKVMYGIVLLRKFKIQFNILTVLSMQLAQEPIKLYEFYKKENFDYIQLIPCLSDLNGSDNSYSLTPVQFATFYKAFYDAWFDDFKKGHYRSIRLFDDIIPMLVDIPPLQCGALGFCSNQFVVESDGSVYPCDFYVLDEYKGGNIHNMKIKQIAVSEPIKTFIKEEKKATPLCKQCSFKSICHGNCKRMNHTYFSEEYCGYQDFLTYAYPTMITIANQLKKK